MKNEFTPNNEINWKPQDADKEAIKYSIRTRVRNAKVSEKAIFLPAKPKPSILDNDKKVVGVYARVSTKSTEQVSSIENQTKYYKEKIRKNPNWEAGKIYCDEGKSGTSIKKRTEFQEMTKDAGDKKVDLILCASVSRFARNVSDCINEVRKLRTTNPSHPVGVYFETEDIYTLDPDSSQKLAMHAMFADWESQNKSRRMILSYDQRICTGQYPVADLLGYRHTADGELIIQKDEALTVKFIFLASALGYSYKEIAEILTEKQRPTLKGRTNWTESMVRSITKNERRWGDLHARKQIVIDLVSRKTTKNRGERDAAYVPEHHEAIISPQIAKAVQYIASSNNKLEGGFSEIAVIKKGGLKGFIKISPYWNAIDKNLLENVSRSAYSEEEYINLQKEVNILTGKEHSKISSLEFATYQAPYGIYFMSQNTPNLTLNKKRLKFNNKCFDKLGNPEYVEILYHPLLQTLILKISSKESKTAFNCLTAKKNYSNIITSPAFCNSIYKTMDWIEEYDFKFKGIFRERGNTKFLVFSLDEPRILTGKKDSNLSGNSIKYIRYKNNQNDPQIELDTNYSLRKIRSKITSAITEVDISAQGTIVENPKIGKIPSKNEIQKELDELLKVM